eukprot:8534502-Pyramimonas_sp.AAC.1
MERAIETTPEILLHPRAHGRGNGGSGGFLFKPEEELEEGKTLPLETVGPETLTNCPSSFRA